MDRISASPSAELRSGMLHTEYAGVALAGGGALHFDPRRADILRRTYTKYCTGVVCLNIDMNEVYEVAFG